MVIADPAKGMPGIAGHNGSLQGTSLSRSAIDLQFERSAQWQNDLMVCVTMAVISFLVPANLGNEGIIQRMFHWTPPTLRRPDELPARTRDSSGNISKLAITVINDCFQATLNAGW
uniref:Uncharacterized protein n=1 Tax=mine drainage metagenome TaxID=410659 RepID=E6QAZ8_9ZZZZ